MTTIASDVSAFEHTRYGVTVKLIPKDGTEETTINLSQSLTELRILKQYDENVFPYYAMTVALSVIDARLVQDAWRSGIVYMTIKKFKTKTQAAGASAGETEETDEYYIKSAPFQIMVCDGAPPHVPEATAANMHQNIPSVLFRMELSSLTAMSTNKKINNAAFHGHSIIEMVASIASNNVPPFGEYTFIMSPPDNKKVYESVFVPPLNFIAAVRHIDKVYGLYAGKLMLFMDVDVGYILSSVKATTVGKTAPKAVVLEYLGPEEAGPAASGTGSAYSAETRAFRLRTSQRITASVDGPARREVVGERVKLVRSTAEERTGSSCKSLVQDSQASPSDVKKERVAWQTFDNPLTIDRMRIEAREQYSPATIIFESCDLNAFSPVLQWTLVTSRESDSGMEGYWRIRAMEAILTKAPGTFETCAVQVAAIIVPSSTEKA